MEQHRIASNLALEVFQIAEIQTPRCRKTYLVYPSMSSGALPEIFLKISSNFGYGCDTEHIQAILNKLRIHPGNILKYYSTL